MTQRPNLNRNTYEPILKTAAADLAAAADNILRSLHNLEDQRRGLPGSGFGGGGGAGGSSSPVERSLGLDTSDDHLTDEELDEKTFTIARDQAQAKLDELAVLIPQVEYVAQRLRSLSVGNAPRAASDKQKREVERTNEHRILCEHCTKHRPKGDECDVHATGDVGGRLKGTEHGLCQWCYDFVRRYDRLPYKADVERHTLGLRAKVTA